MTSQPTQRWLPQFGLKSLFLVTALAGVSITVYYQWHRWYYEYTISSFSTSIAMNGALDGVQEGDRYEFTVDPDKEILPYLFFRIEIANQRSGHAWSNTIHLRKRDLPTGGFDFVLSGDVKTPQTFEFENGDVVRFYWKSESIDRHHTAIHMVANRFRDGRLLETKTDRVEIALSFDKSVDI